MYNKEKYNSLEEYLAAVDNMINMAREKNGVPIEDNTPTESEIKYIGKTDDEE